MMEYLQLPAELGAGTEISVVAATTLTLDGLWHHVAATFDNGEVTVYLDGVRLPLRQDLQPFLPMRIMEELEAQSL